MGTPHPLHPRQAGVVCGGRKRRVAWLLGQEGALHPLHPPRVVVVCARQMKCVTWRRRAKRYGRTGHVILAPALSAKCACYTASGGNAGSPIPLLTRSRQGVAQGAVKAVAATRLWPLTER